MRERRFVRSFEFISKNRWNHSRQPKKDRRKIMSIATKRGDGGQTGLAGGIRISKADLRVEAYGTVDELNSTLGFARSICTNKEVSDWTEKIQRTLFRVGSALATPPESKKTPPSITSEDVEELTKLVHKIET